MKLFDKWLIEQAKKDEKYFKNFSKYAKIIKKEAEKVVGKRIKGYVFGSILKKDEIPQDIDILLISQPFEDYRIRRKIRIKIFEKLKTISPFEIHLITPDQYQNWYRFFIKEKIEIKE